MATSLISTGTAHVPAALRSIRAPSRLMRFAARTRNRAGMTLKTLQKGRMMSALSELSDAQLAEIGISRPEIPRYAERLIFGD